MTEFKDWYYGIPYFTRLWLTGTVGLSLLAKFGLVNPYYLVLDSSLFIQRFHIWRPITALLFYPITPMTGFHFLMNCYFLYNYSKQLETGMFAGKPADFLYMLLFQWFCCVVVGIFADLPILMDPMVLAVLYVWCILNKDVVVSFWFGSRFKAMYLPWVLLAFNVILRGGGAMELVGIVIGHLTFFLMFKYPQEFGGPALLTPPPFLKQMFPDTRYMGGFGSAPQARAPARAGGGGGGGGGGHQWGRGHTLGGN